MVPKKSNKNRSKISANCADSQREPEYRPLLAKDSLRATQKIETTCQELLGTPPQKLGHWCKVYPERLGNSKGEDQSDESTLFKGSLNGFPDVTRIVNRDTSAI